MFCVFFSVDYIWDIWTLWGFHHWWWVALTSGFGGSGIYTDRWVCAKELRKPRSRLETDCLTYYLWQLSSPPIFSTYHCHQELCFLIHSMAVLDTMHLRANLTLDMRWITQTVLENWEQGQYYIFNLCFLLQWITCYVRFCGVCQALIAYYIFANPWVLSLFLFFPFHSSSLLLVNELYPLKLKWNLNFPCSNPKEEWIDDQQPQHRDAYLFFYDLGATMVILWKRIVHYCNAELSFRNLWKSALHASFRVICT